MTPLRRAGNGFTIIEVLIALALLSAVLAALYSTFSITNKAVTVADEELLKLHEARVAIDVMAREVESSLKSGRGASITLTDRDIFGRQASAIAMDTFGGNVPGLAHVVYRVAEKDGTLRLVKEIGTAWRDGPGGAAAIIDDIESFTVEARSPDGWLRTWREGGSPEAIAVTVNIISGGKTITLAETVMAGS